LGKRFIKRQASFDPRRSTSVVTPGTAPQVPSGQSPDHTDAMLQRDGNRRNNMERGNEKSIELTAKELDTVTGGKSIPPRTTLPTNPFSLPSVAKKII
jgi:hypothetical protein